MGMEFQNWDKLKQQSITLSTHSISCIL